MKEDDKKKSDAIVAWLSDHPLISRNMLCQQVGYDASNLQKAIDGKRHIPRRLLEAFEKELTRYGFTAPSSASASQ